MHSKIVEPGEGVCVIAFAGLGGKMDGVSRFEFLKSFAKKHCKRVFLRDLKSCWYHQGIDDDIDSIPALRKYLEQEVHGYEVCTVGCSAGGTAALLFGHLLKAKVAVAFGPQTVISRKGKADIKDRRYGYVHNMLPKRGRRFQDLLPHLQQWNGVTQYRVHVGTLGVDQRHAARIRKCKGVQVIQHNCAAHHVARALKLDGKLQELLDREMGV